MTAQRFDRSNRRLTSNYAFAPVYEQTFTCVHCGVPVSCAPDAAGVQSRNHCPLCGWSRHLDWRTPGDRRSSCRAPMEPIGLTTKRSRNKYARERDGELMLIHRCARCARLVINRVAADDDADRLLALFERGLSMDEETRARLAAEGVLPLGPEERGLLSRRLFGARVARG